MAIQYVKKVTTSGVPQALKSAQGKAHLSKELTGGSGKTEKEYPLPNPHGQKVVPANDLATVAVSMGQTINTGNYSSAKLGVIITMPCNVADIDETFDFSKTWANNKMEEMVEELLGDNNDDGGTDQHV